MLVVMGSLAALLMTQLPWMAGTNFTGFDEWLIIDLVSKGVIDVPHGNRPVHLLWLLPAALVPYSLTPYVVLHGVYRLLSGVLTYLLVRRLAPERLLLAFLTSLLVLVWGPGDLARLSTLERVGYTAFLFGTLLAIWLLVESWRLKNTPLLAFATLAAFLIARSYEAVVPLLACAPLLLLIPVSPPRSRFWTWLAAWEGVVGLSALLVLLPALHPSSLMAYQMQVLGVDANLLHVAPRLFQQYAFHLAPVVLSAPSELAVLAVPIAALTLVVALGSWFWLVGSATDGAESRRFHTRCLLAGLIWAGLGYSVLVLTPSQPTGLRMQFLSAPGIALALASLAFLIGSWLPIRWRPVAVTVVASWLVAVGTGRTVAMQERWDGLSVYPVQLHMLSGLTREVPDVRPGTLITLLDNGRAWQATYGFQHAMRYLYQGRAAGYVHGTWNALYPTTFTPEGIRVEPWLALRKPWGIDVTLTPYDHAIVVRHRGDGVVEVLDQWPPELPPLPLGARYDPRSRIVAGTPLPPERALLR
jgi:hypothetical protein